MAKIVLFIDDDESYLHFLERVSEDLSIISKFLTAKNGKDALEKLQAWRAAGEELPSVMFVDITMPVMDGFQFLETFKAEREAFEELKKIIPIVMLTSSQHEADKEKALATGIVENYVVKPSGIDATVAMLEEFIQ